MIPPAEVRSRLQEERGIYVTEACDRCGQLLGPVRFARKDEPGVWCSRECRDGKEAHAPGTCKHCHATLPKGKRRGALYCDDACKQAAHRSRTDTEPVLDSKLSITKPPIDAAFYSIPQPGSYTPARKPENGLIADRPGLL
jgi:RNase P subunit RPR2